MNLKLIIVYQCFQVLLRDVEKQQGRMEGILAENKDLTAREGEEPTKEDELADELAQLKEETAERIKQLQV